LRESLGWFVRQNLMFTHKNDTTHNSDIVSVNIKIMSAKFLWRRVKVYSMQSG